MTESDDWLTYISVDVVSLRHRKLCETFHHTPSLPYLLSSVHTAMMNTNFTSDYCNGYMQFMLQFKMATVIISL